MKVITIGRSLENNDIVVDDEKVSRNHLQMVMDDYGNYSVVDLGSTNGTFVNGRRISDEVRLQPNDEVRIGQTVLPWQNYFVTSSQTPIVNPPLSPKPPQPNPNRIWIYIVIGAILLLLIGGGVAWKVFHDKQKEKIEQKEKDKKDWQEQQLEQEANDARVEAARLSEEAEIAARKAAESKSEEDKRAAEVAAKKAEDANKLAQQKEEEWKSMKAELEEARAAQQEAEAQNELAQQAKAEAEKESQQAKEAERKAKEAQEYAETEAKLTKEFYSLISKIKPKEALLNKDYYNEICKELKWVPKNGEDKKAFIIRRFDNGDNDQKQRIVNAVKTVLGQQVKEEKVESEANLNVESVEQSKSEINDTIKQ